MPAIKMKAGLAAMAIALAAVLAGAAQTGGFSARPKAPRLEPVPVAGRTEAQVQMLAARPDYNIYKTLAHHPDLYARWSPLGQFLLNGSSLQPRHREMLMLRMGWLCQAQYEWAQHARIATTTAGMKPEEVHWIAEGPAAKGWTPFERALLKAVDEMRYDAMISDATWAQLKGQYSDQQIMEALFTASQYQLVSMALNTLGIQDDPELTFKLPTDLPKPKLAGRAGGKRLAMPRIAPVPVDKLTADQRRIVAPQIGADGKVLNLYGTMINHPGLYGPRASFGTYLMRDSGLPPRTREMVILRTSWLNRAEYEWAHHVSYGKTAGLTDDEIARIAKGPDAKGWSDHDRAVLKAVDELRREAFVTDAIYAVLAKTYSPQRLIELVYTSGGYTMTGIALNSFGVQIEPGYPRFPKA